MGTLQTLTPADVAEILYRNMPFVALVAKWDDLSDGGKQPWIDMAKAVIKEIAPAMIDA